MRGTTIAALTAGLLTAGSTAIELFKRNGPAAIVSMPIERKSIEWVGSRYEFDQLRKRQKTVTETLDNFEVGVLVITSPKQPSDRLLARQSVLRKRDYWHTTTELPVPHRHRE